MLSYRHAFHAGNFADVLKHIMLVECLTYLQHKDKPFDYIDTHAGAGLYALQSTEAEKLREYQQGIGKLKRSDWPQLADYFDRIDAVNKGQTLTFYPGSPLFIIPSMRPQDKAWLFELHPQDVALLRQHTANYSQVYVKQEDGLQGLLALLPPRSRRALVLIDPSYELKNEYWQVIDTLVKAHKKFPAATYLLWYPVVERGKITQMEKQLQASGIRDIQRFELGLTADTLEHGMTSAGLFVVNPPWVLFDKLTQLLPRLASMLSVDGQAFYRCDILTKE